MLRSTLGCATLVDRRANRWDWMADTFRTTRSLTRDKLHLNTCDRHLQPGPLLIVVLVSHIPFGTGLRGEPFANRRSYEEHVNASFGEGESPDAGATTRTLESKQRGCGLSPENSNYQYIALSARALWSVQAKNCWLDGASRNCKYRA